MKKLNVALLVLIMFALSSCSVITGIFKAGVFVGILAVVVVLAAIIWIISLFMGGGK